MSDGLKGETKVAKTGTLYKTALAVMVCASLAACIALTPIRSKYRVALTPVESAERYQIDQTDGGAVFVKEGLRLKVRQLTDEELNAQYPDPSNPFTYRDQVDADLGYVPQRFTVFQIWLNNPTFDKVLLQPHNAVLRTDRGAVMRPYQLTRAEAFGDVRNFETYWLSKGVQSGNIQKLYLERMGVLRGAIYHRDSFVFKGNSYTGRIVFDPLPQDVEQVTLKLQDFVLDFGIYDKPEQQVELNFIFDVESGIVEPQTQRLSQQ